MEGENVLRVRRLYADMQIGKHASLDGCDSMSKRRNFAALAKSLESSCEFGVAVGVA